VKPWARENELPYFLRTPFSSGRLNCWDIPLCWQWYVLNKNSLSARFERGCTR
jgi:hypothetical protein